MAFLHHIGAFGLVAGIAVELVLAKAPIDAGRARRLQRVDLVVGLCAGLVLAAGVLRVLYFEKGAAYYLHNAAFLAKVSLFALFALASIYPTLRFVSWRTAVQQGVAPTVDPATLRRIRAALHVELAGIVLLILCAAMIARGIGTFV